MQLINGSRLSTASASRSAVRAAGHAIPGHTHTRTTLRATKAGPQAVTFNPTSGTAERKKQDRTACITSATTTAPSTLHRPLSPLPVGHGRRGGDLSTRSEGQGGGVVSTGSLPSKDTFGVEEFLLPPVISPEQLEQERAWLAAQVTTWLDEEWTSLQVHADLGRAAGNAYLTLRSRGGEEAQDVSAVLLNMSALLMKFDFKETFTGPFEVANKVMEMVMMYGGCDVCCTSDGDKERMDRVSAGLLSK